jgi:hypothetical protein
LGNFERDAAKRFGAPIGLAKVMYGESGWHADSVLQEQRTQIFIPRTW